MVKVWRTVWVDGEDSVADALNKIETSGEVVFTVVYVRYSQDGRTGWRIICYKENKSNAK